MTAGPSIVWRLAAVTLGMMAGAAACSAGQGGQGIDAEAPVGGDAAATATGSEAGAGSAVDDERAAPAGDDGSVDEVVDLSVAVRPEVVIPDDWPSEIEELYGRYWLYWDAFAAAFGPPHADPDYQPLRELSSPANWESLRQQLTGFEADEIVLVLPDDSITEHLLHLPGTAVLRKNEGVEVILQDCWVDDFVQLTIDGRTLAAAREAKLMNVSMKVVDGQWRVNGVTRSAADTDGFEQCASYVS